MQTADGVAVKDMEQRVHDVVMQVLEQDGCLDGIMWHLDGAELVYYWDHVLPILKQVN